MVYPQSYEGAWVGHADHGCEVMAPCPEVTYNLYLSARKKIQPDVEKALLSVSRC